jgi:hypothetical protein
MVVNGQDPDHPEVVVVLVSVNDPTLDPDVVALGGRWGCARKQNLRPQRLTELLERRHD